MIPDPVDIIYCELCELPHRRGVTMCEECRHAMGTAPNWGQIRADVSDEGRKALAGAGVTILLIELTFGARGPLGTKRCRAVVVPLRERVRWPSTRSDWRD